MMMVMTVIAVVLHLFKIVRAKRFAVKSFLAGNLQTAENKPVRRRGLSAVLTIALLCASAVAVAQYPIDYNSRGEPTKFATPSSPKQLTDINHASLNQLMKVPGITRSWAGRIVRFRPYHTKMDLLEKGVVSDQVYDRIKDYVIAHREKQ
jgi:DNA uptake protein ComE-like DNA-binding protein